MISATDTRSPQEKYSSSPPIAIFRADLSFVAALRRATVTHGGPSKSSSIWEEHAEARPTAGPRRMQDQDAIRFSHPDLLHRLTPGYGGVQKADQAKVRKQAKPRYASRVIDRGLSMCLNVEHRSIPSLAVVSLLDCRRTALSRPAS